MFNLIAFAAASVRAFGAQCGTRRAGVVQGPSAQPRASEANSFSIAGLLDPSANLRNTRRGDNRPTSARGGARISLMRPAVYGAGGPFRTCTLAMPSMDLPARKSSRTGVSSSSKT